MGAGGAKRTEPRSVGKANGRAPGYERLQQLLREEIIEGRLPAGARLKVTEIANRYKTSTNPTREALQGLEGEGLVTIIPNRGARVRSIDEDFIRNIFEIRRLLEPYFVRTFVEFADRVEIEGLESIQVEVQKAVDAGSYPEFHRHNVAFHDHINTRHYNDEAVRLIKAYNSWIRLLSQKNPRTLPHMRRSTAEHWDIVAAAKAGDVDAAADAIIRHVDGSQAYLLGCMRQDRRRLQMAAEPSP